MRRWWEGKKKKRRKIPLQNTWKHNLQDSLGKISVWAKTNKQKQKKEYFPTFIVPLIGAILGQGSSPEASSSLPFDGNLHSASLLQCNHNNKPQYLQFLSHQMYLQTQQLSQFQYLSVNFYCLVHDWFLEFKNSNKKDRFELILNEFWQIHDF